MYQLIDQVQQNLSYLHCALLEPCLKKSKICEKSLFYIRNTFKPLKDLPITPNIISDYFLQRNVGTKLTKMWNCKGCKRVPFWYQKDPIFK